MKIRSRLAFLFALIVASILLVFSLLIYYLTAAYTKQEFYGRMREKASTVASLLFEVNVIDRNLLRTIDEYNLTSLPNEEIVIFDSSNTEVYKSGTTNLTLASSNLDLVRTEGNSRFEIDKRQVMGIKYVHDSNEFVVIISAIDVYGKSKLRVLSLILLSGWAFSVLVVIATGYFFAGRALSPMADVVDQVEKITVSNLNTRVDVGNSKDEIAQLAITFNKMLANLENAFKIQKSFVSHASHELRTPLTAISGQIEVTLLQERTNEEYKAILNSIFDDIRNLSKLSNGLLELAQTSVDLSMIKFELIRVDELLWQARTDVLKKNPNYNIAIEFEEFPEEENMLEIAGNTQWLKSAFLNLMENGCKFSYEKQVVVMIGFRENFIHIDFSNKGIGIAPEDLPLLFEPFFRAENAKSVQGHGIGLSLTEKIISLHKGTIEIESVLNEGATFKISLPYVQS